MAVLAGSSTKGSPLSQTLLPLRSVNDSPQTPLGVIPPFQSGWGPKGVIGIAAAPTRKADSPARCAFVPGKEAKPNPRSNSPGSNSPRRLRHRHPCPRPARWNPLDRSSLLQSDLTFKIELLPLQCGTLAGYRRVERGHGLEGRSLRPCPISAAAILRTGGYGTQPWPGAIAGSRPSLPPRRPLALAGPSIVGHTRMADPGQRKAGDQ